MAVQGEPVRKRPGVLWHIGVWFPVVFIMAGIFGASSLPASDIPSLFSFQDVIFHAIIYALLGAAFYHALVMTRAGAGAGWVCILATVVFCTLYGVSDEFHQSFIPGRCATGWDVLTDFIGSFCGAVTAALLTNGKNKSV